MRENKISLDGDGDVDIIGGSRTKRRVNTEACSRLPGLVLAECEATTGFLVYWENTANTSAAYESLPFDFTFHGRGVAGNPFAGADFGPVAHALKLLLCPIACSANGSL